MSRHTVSLKSRVRYEGRAQIFDRRAMTDTALEKLPNPIWRTVGQVLRSNFRPPLLSNDAKKRASDAS